MKILHAKAEHIIYSKEISLCIDESAKVRGTGIARRTPEYIAKKIENRNLELSKARLLALDGDLNGVLKEIVKNVGTEVELNKLNRFERGALARALGLEATELAKIVSLQGKSVVQQKTFADLAGEDGLSALTSIQNKFKEIGATVLKELGEPLLTALKNIQKNFFTPENIQKIKTSLIGIVGIIKGIGSAASLLAG